MFYDFISSPYGITRDLKEHHHNVAVMPIYKGKYVISSRKNKNVKLCDVLGIFRKSFPNTSPNVSPI